MTPEELLRAADQARPDLMMKTAVALKAVELVSPEFASEVVEEFKVIASTAHEKVSAVGGWAAFGAAVGGSALSALGGAVASDLYDAAKRGLTKGTNFKRMMEANPTLSAYKKQDVQRAFNTLHRYAPEFTADPNLGGQIIQTMTELPNNQRQLISELINSRKNIRDVRKNQFSMGSAPFILSEKKDDPSVVEGIRHKNQLALETHKAGLRAKADAARLEAEHRSNSALERLRAANNLTHGLDDRD